MFSTHFRLWMGEAALFVSDALFVQPLEITLSYAVLVLLRWALCLCRICLFLLFPTSV